jgi:hypothetical protein
MTQQQKIQMMLIRRAFERKEYEFFEKGQYNLNIVGIRSGKRASGTFEDFIVNVYKDEYDFWRCDYYPATTDAGTYWLARPMNMKGTALLVPGQYKGAYRKALHKGQYEALVQSGLVKVYRDNNKDYINDYDPSSIEEGLFGINIHRSNPIFESEVNSRWSAGCQVFKNPNDYDAFMSVVEKSIKLYGNKFTYTLLTAEDFDEL